MALSCIKTTSPLKWAVHAFFLEEQCHERVPFFPQSFFQEFCCPCLTTNQLLSRKSVLARCRKNGLFPGFLFLLSGLHIYQAVVSATHLRTFSEGRVKLQLCPRGQQFKCTHIHTVSRGTGLNGNLRRPICGEVERPPLSYQLGV